MSLKTTKFDVSEYLDDPEMISEYLSDALSISLQDDDFAFFSKALGNVAKAQGMSKIAEATGLGRESLYKTISGETSPRFDTIARVLRAMNLRVTVNPVDDSVDSDVLANKS